MQTPAFIDGQFVDGTLLNGAVAQLMSDFELIGSELHTAGLLNPSSLSFTPSNLTITVHAPPPFAVLFGSGLVAQANGVVSGAISSTYVVSCSSLVPGSGPAVTVYLLGSYGQIGQQETQVIGPPQGHPDFDPTFAPFQFYLENLDTLGISASLTPPNNSTTFELAHFQLAVGQTTITQGSISSTWKYASAVLNPTGVIPDTYVGASITVGLDGRVTAASGVAYGPLAGTNSWTGTNAFSHPVTVTDTGNGGLVVNGTGNSAGANIALEGNGSTTPNKFIRVLSGAFQIVNSAYSAAILTLSDVGALVTAKGIISTSGDIVANSGHLRASMGAAGSGDATVATLLSDFPSLLSGNGWKKIADDSSPTGYFIIQWGVASSQALLQDVTFPIPFPNACLHVGDLNEAAAISSNWGLGLPDLMGVQSGSVTTTGFSFYSLHWNGSGWSGGSPGSASSPSWTAKGY